MSKEWANAGRQVFPRGPSNSDFRTPLMIIEQLEQEMGERFDFDVAASHENAVVPAYYNIEDNGLKQFWPGRVWCNPPYNAIMAWVQKAAMEARMGWCDVVWMLLPARTSTRWWARVMEEAAEIRLIKGRLNFGGPHSIDGNKATAPFPSALVRYGGETYEGEILLADRTGRVILNRRNGDGMAFKEAVE